MDNYTLDILRQVLIDFAAFSPFSGLSDDEQRLVEQSCQAFLMTERRQVREKDNVIYSDSESNDPGDWMDVGKRPGWKNEIACDKWEMQKKEEEEVEISKAEGREECAEEKGAKTCLEIA